MGWFSVIGYLLSGNEAKVNGYQLIVPFSGAQRSMERSVINYQIIRSEACNAA